MKLKFKQLLAGLLIVPALALAGAAVLPSQDVSAVGLSDGINAARGSGQRGSLNLTSKKNNIVKDIINWMLWAVGVISVIMIIFGGIRYSTSGGDQNKVTSAKNTITYAVIGLIVAILSYALVELVFQSLTKP